MMEGACLIRWDSDQEAGFLQPDKGKKLIALHARALPRHQRHPRVGDRMLVRVETDGHGQLIARSARICGWAWSPLLLMAVMAAALVALALLLALCGTVPPPLVAIYLSMSLATIGAYHLDKGRAERQLWRIPEKRLHLLEFFGGWPGGFLAQILFRHKLKKFSYQVIFWLIVASHGGAWYYGHGHPAEIRKIRDRAVADVGMLLAQGKAIVREVLPETLIKFLPATPSQGAAPWSTSNRSTAKAPANALITKAMIKEIRPEKGLVVVLDQGIEGTVRGETLAADFASSFSVGETVRFAVLRISETHGRARAEGVIVDP